MERNSVLTCAVLAHLHNNSAFKAAFKGIVSKKQYGSHIEKSVASLTFFGFTHFLALGICEQGNGHCVGVLTEFFTDEFRSAKHIAPLVVTAELHITTVIFEQVVEVVTLHNHIVEFKE